jgi:two-component system, OmpR family, response regulator PhoP
MRILIVEDEDALREELRSRLVASGFGVDVAADGEEGLFAGLNYALDAAVVDVGLPIRSGLEVIRDWRFHERRFPVVVLTARSGWRNRVDGFEAGADDYLEKPFSFVELLVRIRSAVRRAHGWCNPLLVCGPYALDTQTMTASIDGKLLELTTFEFRLLQMLMMNAGKVLSATTLAEHIYDESVDRDSNIIQHFVYRLRRKLDPLDVIKPIATVYGGGYLFAIARGRAK